MSSNLEGDLRSGLLEHAIRILKPGETCTLASGMVLTAGYYADLKPLATMPWQLKLMAEAVLFGPLDASTRYLGGVPTGGLVPLGAIGVEAANYSQFSRLRLFYVRSEQKGHGTNHYVEGWLADDGPAVMLEDVVSTGGTLVDAILKARSERQADIRTAICILDREMGGREALAKIGVELRPLFTASGLNLPKCVFA